MRLQAVYEKYKDKVSFLWVYTREAHASNSMRPAKHVEIAQPTSFLERSATAKQCSAEIDLKIPQLVDDMKDSVAKAFHALPDRLFILGTDGTIAYRGDRGPRGFKVDEMEASLQQLLAKPAAEPAK